MATVHTGGHVLAAGPSRAGRGLRSDLRAAFGADAAGVASQVVSAGCASSAASPMSRSQEARQPQHWKNCKRGRDCVMWKPKDPQPALGIILVMPLKSKPRPRKPSQAVVPVVRFPCRGLPERPVMGLIPGIFASQLCHRQAAGARADSQCILDSHPRAERPPVPTKTFAGPTAPDPKACGQHE